MCAARRAAFITFRAQAVRPWWAARRRGAKAVLKAMRWRGARPSVRHGRCGLRARMLARARRVHTWPRRSQRDEDLDPQRERERAELIAILADEGAGAF
eukprot:2075356-Prymnesium_polylepis.2